MGSADVQGALWGARAQDWAHIQEPSWQSVFAVAMALAGARRGASVLDIGCGSGGALAIASEMGANVTGLDAAEALAVIARRRLPQVHIEVGDMERLPFPDASFDVVTGINSFQFAQDIVSALSEAKRVCKPTGTVLLFVWGPREQCELISLTLPSVFALLPQTQGAPPAPWIGDKGVVESYLAQAGLDIVEDGSLTADLAFAADDAAIRAILSASARVIAVAGEESVARAVRMTLDQVRRPDGSVAWTNSFRWFRTRRRPAG